MKKYLIYTLLFVAALTGCEKTLEFEVKDKITLDNFFQTEDDAVASVNAIYDVLCNVNLYRSTAWLIQDIASDDCDALSTWNDPNAQQIDRYQVQATNTFTTGLWRDLYQVISRANLSIARIPQINMDESLKKRLLSEAKFLRAFSYFNLVRLFGDVPLVLEPESDIQKYLVPRTPMEEVYDQIKLDLQEAANVLPRSYSGTGKGRATKGAALGILAKVHLTLQEWDEAASKSLEVMGLGVYSLWDDFKDNFREVNKNGKESVFEVQFYSNVQTENTQIVISGLPSLYVFPAAVGIILPTEDLLNSFEPGDHRFDVTFFDEYFSFGWNRFDPHIWKHWDQNAYPPDKTGQSGANFPVMRYAEVLLMYAEALNEQNQGPTQEAYDAINKIRERARNGVDTVMADLNGLTYQEFQLAVLKEKRCETVNEGQRWFDLVRTGNLEEFVKRAKGEKADPKPFNYLFPIPQREMDLNPELVQNDQY